MSEELMTLDEIYDIARRIKSGEEVPDEEIRRALRSIRARRGVTAQATKSGGRKSRKMSQEEVEKLFEGLI